MYFFKCSIILFRSSEKPGALFRPDGFLTLLHSSKLSSRGDSNSVAKFENHVVRFIRVQSSNTILHNSVQMFLVQVTWNVSSRGIVCINTSVPDELLSLSRW